MSAATVLVVAAHPDDEVLGCGGTIARHAAAGDVILTMFLTDGEGARPDAGMAQIGARRDAAREAACSLGSLPPLFFTLPDNRLDSVPLLDIVRPIEDVLRETAPRVVYTHHAGDLNIDHRRVHQAVMTACRPQIGHPVERIYAFEVPSSTEWSGPGFGPAFEPTRFVDIALWLDRKADALAAYAAELRPPPHPRSRDGIDNLARWRGATAGMAAAEAFMVLRQLDR